MNMHNAWLLRETDLTINLPSEYLFMFYGTLKLIDVCDNRDANTFD